MSKELRYSGKNCITIEREKNVIDKKTSSSAVIVLASHTSCDRKIQQKNEHEVPIAWGRSGPVWAFF